MYVVKLAPTTANHSNRDGFVFAHVDVHTSNAQPFQYDFVKNTFSFLFVKTIFVCFSLVWFGFSGFTTRHRNPKRENLTQLTENSRSGNDRI